MSRGLKRTEGGRGGKVGHSNMAHWEPTEHVKEAARRARRSNDRLAEADCEPPARQARLPLGCRTPVVVSIARRVESAKDFAALPVLADALEEAGCIDPAVLGHCRAGAAHGRGCWVVDLCLGRD